MRKQRWDVDNTFNTEYSLSFTPEMTGLPDRSPRQETDLRAFYWERSLAGVGATRAISAGTVFRR